MQGLSSRAHAFSVEALVGKSCKRLKVETVKEEKLQTIPITDPDTGGEEGEARDGAGPGTTTEEPCDPEPQVRVDLQGSDLWRRFHEIGTEMIITKAGR
ncbi:hypothetical protein SRHO_G00128010 [Serrasalmus rhombeus]